MSMDYLCPECGSDELSWTVEPYNSSSVVDGRLRLHDINVRIVLGCDECSETVCVRDGAYELEGFLGSRFFGGALLAHLTTESQPAPTHPSEPPQTQEPE